MKNLFKLLFLAGAMHIGAHSQVLVSGSVNDDKQNPLSFAIVKMLNLPDSSFYQGASSDESGKFSFKQVKAGKFLLQISFIGYTTNSLPIEVGMTDLFLNPIILKQSTNELNEVVIKSRKPFVENSVDKMVLNVSSEPTVAGLNSFEILQRAPGVMIDPNENLQIGGKQGVNVLVDGKTTYMSSRDLANYLKSLQANTIEKIEVITNPSAKYDAQGNAGIINIILKKNINVGLNGNLSAGYTQSIHNRKNISTDFNFRRSHYNVFGYLSLNDGVQHTASESNRALKQSQMFQQGKDTEDWNGRDGRLGIDYFIGQKHTIGAMVIYNYSANELRNLNLITLNSKDTNTPLGKIDVVNSNPTCQERASYNLNYKYADTLGTSFNLDADFVNFGGKLKNDLVNTFQTPEGLNTGKKTINNYTDGSIRVYTLKGDYSKEWKKSKFKLDAGFKSSITQTGNQFRVYLNPQYNEFDAKQSNDFEYNETIHAGYLTVNKKINKLSMIYGLRVESTDMKGVSTDLSGAKVEKPNRNYISAFPTAYFQYDMSSDHTVGLAIGRRINRPTFQDLNPFYTQLDLYTFESGNPSLNPSFSNYLETYYSYKGAAFIRMNYSETKDIFSQIARKEGDSFYLFTANTGSQRNYNFSIGSPLPISKKWDGYMYLGPFYNEFQGRLVNGDLDVRTWGFSGYLGNYYKVTDKTTIELSGWYNAPTKQTIFHNKGMGAVNVGVQTKTLSDKLILKAGVSDVFNSLRYRSVVNFNDLNFDLYRKWESRRASLTLTYIFGKSTIKEARNRDVGASNEKDRIKFKKVE